ncbi:MAG: hypothetical protein ISS78_06005 [Phycisphaerae bacterium]|nr:hypothetical protein [Phycisphaerae bacterium]
MTEANVKDKPEQQPGKGKAFFDRAEQVAETGNWDFAIEMYVEGIKREPDNVKRGHQPLRETSLKRKLQGGKPAGRIQQFKRRPGKDPLDNLINAEYLLSKDPGAVGAIEQVLKAAIALKLDDVVHWIANILLQAQRQAAKPDKRILVEITHAFRDIEDYAQGIAACEMAQKLDPEDGKLHQMLGDLSAKYAIKKGRYDEKGDFTKGVRDMDKQKELMVQDSMVQDEAYLRQQIEKARADYLESPTVPGKINALADALLKISDEKHENEAIELLTSAHQQLGAYHFKMRVGDIRIKQMTRRYRQYVAADKQDEAIKQVRRQLAFELEEFAERAANYPTDLNIKFELGRRQFIAGKYDDAIASLQEAQREPRRRLEAMNYLGQAFAKKGWTREAADTFDRALQAEVAEERAKDLRYNLGCALEQMGQFKRAQDEFSTIAQQDYNYKDVRQKLEYLHKKLQQQRESKDQPT